MSPSTEGKAVSPLMLGSQGCWSTAFARASPLRLACACSQRSASTTCTGKVEAPRTWARRGSGYKATGATNCCNCSGVLVAYPGPCALVGGVDVFCVAHRPAGKTVKNIESANSKLEFRRILEAPIKSLGRRLRHQSVPRICGLYLDLLRRSIYDCLLDIVRAVGKGNCAFALRPTRSMAVRRVVVISLWICIRFFLLLAV